MSEVIQRSKHEAKVLAKEKGLICFFPHSDELFLDLDDGLDVSPTALECLEQQITAVRITATLETISQSKTGKHVYYKLNRKVTPTERIALQAALGSDPVKEVLSLTRVLIGCEAPVALFETPKQAKKVRAWREQQDREPPAKQPYAKYQNSSTHSQISDDDVPF